MRVAPCDVDRSWTFRAGPEGAVAGDDDGMRQGDEGTDEVRVTFTRTAGQLYLGLWNRGDEVTAQGQTALLDRWRGTQHVPWR